LPLFNSNFGLDSEDQSFLTESGCKVAEQSCYVLSLAVGDFTKSLLTPNIKAVRERVIQECKKGLHGGIHKRLF
jgi:hypothetical protein